MNTWTHGKKFELPIPLDKKHYYNELNDTNISDKDLEHKKTYVIL